MEWPGVWMEQPYSILMGLKSKGKFPSLIKLIEQEINVKSSDTVFKILSNFFSEQFSNAPSIFKQHYLTVARCST